MAWPQDRCEICVAPQNEKCFAQLIKHSPICDYIKKGDPAWIARVSQKPIDNPHQIKLEIAHSCPHKGQIYQTGCNCIFECRLKKGSDPHHPERVILNECLVCDVTLKEYENVKSRT